MYVHTNTKIQELAINVLTSWISLRMACVCGLKYLDYVTNQYDRMREAQMHELLDRDFDENQGHPLACNYTIFDALRWLRIIFSRF